MTDRRTDTPEQVTDPFLVALQKALRPEVLVDLGDQLAQVLDAVEDLGKAGKLQLTLAVKPYTRVHGAVEVTASVKSTVPQPEPVARLMYVDQGRLVPNDPNQLEMFTGPRAIDVQATTGDPEEAAR